MTSKKLNAKFVLGLIPVAVMVIQGCTNKDKVRQAEEVKVDYVAGSTGDDKVIKSEGNAFMYSDRPAVQNYNITVDAIEHSTVEGDVAAWAACQRAINKKRQTYADISDNAPPCRDKVIQERHRAGTDMVDAQGKLVVRKKIDFNLANQDAQTCLDTIIALQKDLKKKYSAESCAQILKDARTEDGH
jgi:hypothetical protein